MKLLFIIIPIIIFILSMLFTISALYRDNDKFKGKRNMPVGIISIIISVISLFTLIIVPGSIHQINAGEIAVIKVWGESKHIRTAGVYYDFWLSSKYEIYDAKVQQVIIDTYAYSSDSQTMEIELIVQYQIQPDKVIQITNNYGGLEMLESRIKTVSTEKMKSELSKRKAELLISNRQEISPAVETSIRNTITNDYYVDIITVVLTDISFTDAFEKSVEDKMIAEQEMRKAEYENLKAVAKAEADALIAIEQAKVKLALAQADADAIEVVAKAQANSIKLKSIEVARMLGFKIESTTTTEGILYNIKFTEDDAKNKTIATYLQYIEYLETWDGVLPTTLISDDAANILIPIGG